MEKNQKFIVGICIFFVAMIVIVAFALAYAGRDQTQLKDRKLHLSVNGYVIEIPLSEDGASYDLPCLTSEKENTFELLSDVNATVKIGKKTLKEGKEVKINVPSLSPDNRLVVKISSGKDTRTIYFRTYSSELPELVASGEGSGNYYVTLSDKPVMMKLDSSGKVVYYVALTGDSNSDVRFSDFSETTTESGSTLYSYHKSDGDIGRDYIMNDAYESVLDEDSDGIMITDTDSSADNTALTSTDSGGMVVIDENNYIVQGTVNARVDNVPAKLNPAEGGALIVNPVIQEYTNNKVDWQLFGSDESDFYEMSSTNNNYSSDEPQDYLHISSMCLDPEDNNLIVSFKNANAIVKIDRESKKILWILGGNSDQFGLSDDQKWSSQTKVTMPEKNRIVITAGNKIINLKIDETAKKVSSYTSYDVSTGEAVSTSSSEPVYVYSPSDSNALIEEKNLDTGKLMLKVTTTDTASVSSLNFSKTEE